MIALDNRGHGQSQKLYEPAAYHTAIMAEDTRALLDHLGLDRADVMGYSMGARIAAYLALARPDRTRSLIMGGLGIHLVEGVGLPLGIADAMEAPSADALADPTQRSFRLFAEQTKSDLKALAACIRGSRQVLSREQAASMFIRQHRAQIRQLVARWTGENQLTLDAVLDDMITRCRAHNLRAVGSERKLLTDFTVLLTAKTMHALFGPSRRKWIAL